MLPCWGLVDFGRGVRVAGRVEAATIGDAPFVVIKPVARERILVNAEQVTAVLPCSETTARLVSLRQWQAVS